MSRLADYFVVVGYDFEKSRTGNGSGCGKVMQRLPTSDWDDCSFTPGIEHFCQPAGWKLHTCRQQPTFHVSVLTDIDADRHYCACLTFTEDIPLDDGLQNCLANLSTSSNGTVGRRKHLMLLDEEQELADETSDPALVPHSKLFAPKTLVLVSRLDYTETLRNCLGIMFTAYIENQQVDLETIVGNILGCIYIPAPGGPQVRFSVGAGDKQALQPPLSSTLPVTRSTCAVLFQQLGITNTINVFCAALTDHKILFHSQQFSRLTDASHALTALMYPLKYSYVYIPILPSVLGEVLNTPTPFICGVHCSLKSEFSDLLDVIIADLDGGSVHVPEHVSLCLVPDPMLSRLYHSLQLILSPDLASADYAFQLPPSRLPLPDFLDKQIRAIFLRLFAEIFFAYRSCLTIIRIHPEPFITFHKASYLGSRNYVDDGFVSRLLDSMSFNDFVMARGPPFRVCDLFDDVYANMPDRLKAENDNKDKLLENISDLAQQLYTNEKPSTQPYVQKLPRPSDGAYKRIHQPCFQLLREKVVCEIIKEGLLKHQVKAKLSQMRVSQARIVPIGPHISSCQDKSAIISTNARRLEVLCNCINFIFENRISDARKIFPAVLRALKNRVARQTLVEQLAVHVSSNRAMLEHQQFDMVMRLLNCALQNDSAMDENGIAAGILPLSTSFCRKLCTGVIQFAYTIIQEHPVWSNMQFWEAAFYQDVELQIRQLYMSQYDNQSVSEIHSNSAFTVNQLNKSRTREDVKNGDWRQKTPDTKRRKSLTPIYQPREIKALEIAAEQMRIWPNLNEEERKDLVKSEESIVYSQAIHYANRMVYLRVPLDASRALRDAHHANEAESSSSNVANSFEDSDSVDAESGFDEQDVSEVGLNVIKTVTRFVDKVCCESGVTAEHVKALHQMVPGVVHMHIETLEAVNRERKRLPPIPKPKILVPTLLPGEEIVMEGLRAYLMPDGREEGTGSCGGPQLLPAEGAIFLTTYRIIFCGLPCDPLACELVICRSFPASTLTREKKISAQHILHSNQWLQEGLQLRSSTFQLIKVAFDDEVVSEDIETLRKLLHKVSCPQSIQETFAFTGFSSAITGAPKSKDHKQASIKNLAKRTLARTVKRAGIKSKEVPQKKYVLPTPLSARRVLANKDRFGGTGACEQNELTDSDAAAIAMMIENDSRNIERLSARCYCRDYKRLGLGDLLDRSGRGDSFRLTMVNMKYMLCRSYPSVLVVPQSVGDESLRKFARSHRQNRFPVVTWRHSQTRGVLLRASGFHGKGIVGMLKHHSHHSAPPGTASEMSTSIEQEKYFRSLVAIALSAGVRRVDTKFETDSVSSQDSLVLSVGGSESIIQNAPDTPESLRKNPLARAVTTLRSSGGKFKTVPESQTAQTMSRLGSLRQQSNLVTNSRPFSVAEGPSYHRKEMAAPTFSKAALYVLGEKTQMKGIKMESFPKCDFIPIEYDEVRHVKSSFKKLMRACTPSALQNENERGFLKAIEESEWLKQLQNIMQVSGAIVDLLDVQGSSVMVCLEDGWDFTTQVCSISQLLMDPFYRTLEGFRLLIEKEWLSFGHRFTHRSNQTASNQTSAFAPIFLQFLDIVHQILSQFPLSFEFNQYLLKFLAYHYVSNRFRSFMLDNEYERVEAGWLLERYSSQRLSNEDSDSENEYVQPKNQRVHIGMSIWDYIEKHSKKSPIFYNFMYSPSDHDFVLRPYSNISNLRIWDYYIKEYLSHGPSYDFEIISLERKHQEEHESMDGPIVPASRRLINGAYDNVELLQSDSCCFLLKELHRLAVEEGEMVQSRWKHVWMHLEQPDRKLLSRQASFNTQVMRSHGRSIHKRLTIEILVRGKILGEASKMFNNAHHFDKFTFTQPAYCDYCQHFLWGLTKAGLRCSDCGFNCHERCATNVAKNCTKLHSMADVSSTSLNNRANSETSSITGETRTHEGYLFKRGALLKGWKQRWFVLDSMKHQLRYYDSMEDGNCKGFIDLVEVVSATLMKNVQGAPKKSDESAAFELRTLRRLYHFLAPDQNATLDWIEKIQSCIQ